MNTPHKCPICEGRGELGKKLAQVGSVVVSQKPFRVRCHGCFGAGIIWGWNIDYAPPIPITPTPWVTNPEPRTTWNKNLINFLDVSD
jgi:hypothetical protein